MAEILTGPQAIAQGVVRLAAAQLVAFPTETVYGLGANALDPAAVQRVFDLKGRPSTNPLIVHVAGIEMAKSVVADWTPQADLIARAFWPGPITIILPKAGCVPAIVCAEGDTVAVRCPGHPLALALIETFAGPIVGPSANPSGRISPTIPEHVADGFPNAELIIIDGGHCRAGIESTVLDLTGNTPRILRPGIIGAHALAQALAQPVECPATQPLSTQPAPAQPIARSPGTIGAHYQPKTPTKLVESSKINEADAKITVLAWSIESHPSNGHLISISDQLDEYASAIYRLLHDADRTNSTQIWVEPPPQASNDNDRAIREAILERLERATHA